MSVTESILEETTVQEESPLVTSFPKSVITLVVLGICILIGVAIAKLVDIIHDRLALRDDASDMSEHTKDLLKARVALTNFTNGVQEVQEKRKKSIAMAKNFGAIWRSKATKSLHQNRMLSCKAASQSPAEITRSGSIGLVSYTPHQKVTPDKQEWHEIEISAPVRESTRIDIIAEDDEKLSQSANDTDIADNILTNGSATPVQEPNSVVHHDEFQIVMSEIHDDSNKEKHSENSEPPSTANSESSELEYVLAEGHETLNILTSRTLPESIEEKDSYLKDFSLESDIQNEGDSFVAKNGKPSGDVFCISLESRKNTATDLSVLVPVTNTQLPKGQGKKNAWTETRVKTAKHKRNSTSQNGTKRPTTGRQAKSNVRPLTAGISRPITPGGRNRSVREPTRKR